MADVCSGASGTRVRVLQGFELHIRDRTARLAGGAQRLLALLALADRPTDRGVVAARLWPDLPEVRAAATLRTTLWQARRAAPGAVANQGGCLGLGPAVRVDLHESTRAARALATGEDPPGDVAAAFGHDVLPDWPEDWVLAPRERFRQIRLHALDTLCRRLTGAGRHAEAIVVGLGAVAADPLRETAQRALIEAHIAEGNISEAVRQYRAFAAQLWVSLGLDPTPELTTLLQVPPVRLRTGRPTSIAHR